MTLRVLEGYAACTPVFIVFEQHVVPIPVLVYPVRARKGKCSLTSKVLVCISLPYSTLALSPWVLSIFQDLCLHREHPGVQQHCTNQETIPERHRWRKLTSSLQINALLCHSQNREERSRSSVLETRLFAWQTAVKDLHLGDACC